MEGRRNYSEKEESRREGKLKGAQDTIEWLDVLDTPYHLRSWFMNA